MSWLDRHKLKPLDEPTGPGEPRPTRPSSSNRHGHSHRSRRADRLSSSSRAGRAKRLLAWISQFTLTVICSALLSIWLQKEWRLVTPTSKKTVTESKKGASRSNAGDENERSSAQVPVGKMEDLYRKHLQEILHSLRGNSQVRMVKLRLPTSVLKFQRNLASASDGESFRLEGRTDELPFIAVSISAQKFLDQMLVSYIHPKNLPPGLITASRLPFNASALTQFLLLPDLSGNNAAFFTFEREPASKK